MDAESLRKTIIAELYKRHPSLGARSIDEFADFVVGLTANQDRLCKLLDGLSNVTPGWGCCQCRIYNGLQRKECKRCGHKPCVELPLPEKYGLCNECGVPQGVAHVGH